MGSVHQCPDLIHEMRTFNSMNLKRRGVLLLVIVCFVGPIQAQRDTIWAKPYLVGDSIPQKGFEWSDLDSSFTRLSGPLYFSYDKEVIWRVIDSTRGFSPSIFRLDSTRITIPTLSFGEEYKRFVHYPIHWEGDCLFFLANDRWHYVATWRNTSFVAYSENERPVNYQYVPDDMLRESERLIYSPTRAKIIYWGARKPAFGDELKCKGEW